MRPVPTSIQKKSDHELFIAFSTGENRVVSFAELRFQCRCAVCVDEWTSKRRIRREQIPADIRAVRVEPVGRYAIQIDFSDGHATGIYSYEHLYEIANGRGADQPSPAGS